MLVFLLTAPLLTFTVCLSFSAQAREGDQFIRPWFAGLGSGVLLVGVETLVRLAVSVRVTSSVLFFQLSARETTAPLSIVLGLFFLFARRFRSAEPDLQELGLAAFLSGALTVRAVYHALYVADAATIYWGFLAPSISVAAVFTVPFFVRMIREQFGWLRVALIAALALFLFVLSGVPLLDTLHYHVLSAVSAGVLALVGAGLWMFRRFLIGAVRAS